MGRGELKPGESRRMERLGDEVMGDSFQGWKRNGDWAGPQCVGGIGLRRSITRWKCRVTTPAVSTTTAVSVCRTEAPGRENLIILSGYIYILLDHFPVRIP